MDSKPILDALREAVHPGVMGYESPSTTLLETVAARAFSFPKKGYLIQPPVYNEFHELKIM